MYACFGVDDCLMPGDTIPPNQPDSVKNKLQREKPDQSSFERD